MSIHLVDDGWSRLLFDSLVADSRSLRIICPFIKRSALQFLLAAAKPGRIEVITRFNLQDCADGVHDLGALRVLLDSGAQVRGVRNLHAKVYLFGSSRVVVTSANLTMSALRHNHELGFWADEESIVGPCHAYFDRLWSRAGQNLTAHRLARFEKLVIEGLASGGTRHGTKLKDEGTDAGLQYEEPPPLSTSAWLAEHPHAFVKFLGEGSNRVPLSFATLEQIKRSGCHWAVAYPMSKRPTGVSDGSAFYIARLTEHPNDIRIFGRAIGMRYVAGRDDATKADIARRSWKRKWSRYVRVHDPEFVAGSMSNGVSLNELMQSLGARSFESTLRNSRRRMGNTDPRRAYRQQAAVKLSAEGESWLRERLEAAFVRHGRMRAQDLAGLDWPKVPTSASR